MQRREFISLVGCATVWPLAARAQSSGNLPTVGFLSGVSVDTFPDRLDAFRKGLRETGYTEERNVAINYRWAEFHNDRLPRLAAELVDRKVSVIAAIGGPAIALAAKAATTTIPIVFQVGVDPVEVGLVTSLAHPGGNTTGITSLNVDVGSKRLELMHILAPEATAAAILINPTNPTNAANDTKYAQTAASKLAMQLYVLQASTEDDFKNVFAKILELRIGGLLLGTDELFTSHKEQLIDFSIRNSLPTISPFRDYVQAGGLMSYGGDIVNSWFLAGEYTGRVLKGEKPADLPVQRATKVQLVINLKTAKQLGIKVPEELLARADEVIE
jgi:putative tryptophan/tyrosine transport system substrate-binding protein